MTFLDELRKLRPRKPPPARDQLIEDIRDVRRQLESVHSYFALETDEDLLDAAIYHREALEARYRYLLRLARERNTTVTILPVSENQERQIN